MKEAVRRTDWAGAIVRSLALVLLAGAGIRLISLLGDPFGERFLANDLNGYLAGARRFLDTGSPYLSEQLTGSWRLLPDSFIHPPAAVHLFVPFLVLPAVLWWLIPIGLTAASIVRMRPAAWSWPVMAACLLWPRTAGTLIAGNTDMWISAALGVTLAWSIPVSVLLLLKPSYLPLAIAGMRWRSWWIASVIVAAACLPFGTLWFDYVAVIRGAPIEPSYSLLNVPYVAIPLIAWVGRTRPAPLRRPLWPVRITASDEYGTRLGPSPR